jgi:uncharacterized cofD-like protein
VVALGGGHGLSVTLRAVRRYAGSVTAVVSVADDGGSSGRLRQIFGIPAPGDLRRCLVAMADPDSLWGRAFDHRFGAGELEGHAVGNLVIAGLAEVTGDFAVAVEEAARLLGVEGQVLPATSVPVVLKADVGGREVVGQARVADADGPISGVAIVPPDAPAPPEVVEAIAEADQVVIGPGSLFTSVLATCAVPDIRAALAARSGGRVYVCNLRPQLHETEGYGAVDHLAALASHGVVVDVMVHDPDALPLGGGRRGLTGADPTTVLAAAVARSDGDGHDVGRLAAVLAGLCDGFASRHGSDCHDGPGS